MSRSHIAYGPKDAIGKVIAGRHIPTNCLVITKVEDPAEEAELLYFDKDYTPHQISMRHVFPSMEVATEWVGRYYCVGRHIVVKDSDEWHSYIVGDDNELIVADGTDKVSIVTAGDASVVVNGETMTPTISVNLDPEFANGLAISEDGLMLNLATDSKAGAMSAADKFKLSEIEAGAQVNTITDIETGSANGTISVNGVDVSVKGLGSAAFTNSDAYTPAGVGMSYVIVQELPSEGSVGVIYLVPNEGEGENVYDEFLFVNGEPELIGTTETDLSDYYTKGEVIDVIRSEVDDAITGKVDTISLARVATTGSFNDLNDKPGIPIVLDVTKRNDGLYHPSISYQQGIAILESGGQLSIHWPENNLVYQCKQWRSTSSSIFFGTQDENTHRVLRWNSLTGTVEPFSNNTFATAADLSDKVDKVSGKGLSTNDFTNAEKNKLAGFGDASLYALKTDLELLYRYKGSVATESALPNSGTNVAGDVYNVEETGMNYAWNGTSWDALGADPAEIPDPVDVDPISNSSIDDIIGSDPSSSDPSDAMQTVETDRSLSHDGVPADAKATGDAIAAETSARQTQVAALQNAVGSPLVANTAAGMTSTDKIYVYTGSETGYTAGHWYYHDGSAWADGGVYNSTALETDTTLLVSGMAADAKTTGDEIADLKSALNESFNGKQYINGTFSYGVFENNFPVTDPRKFNAVTMSAEKFDREVTIEAKTGYNFLVYLYDNSDTYVSKSTNWETRRTIQANTKFRLWVRPDPLDTSIVLNLKTVKENIIFNTPIQDDVDANANGIQFVKNNIEATSRGIKFIDTSFVWGTMNTTTGAVVVDTAYKYQVVTPFFVTYDTDVVLDCNTGYKYQVLWYSDEDAYISRTGSFKVAGQKYTVTAGTHFRLFITLDPANTSANVSPSTFAKSVFIVTKIQEDINATKDFPLTTFPQYVVKNLSSKPLGELSKGYILLSFDDGALTLATGTIPLLIQNEVPGTFGLLPESAIFASGNESELATVVDAVDNHGCVVAMHGSAQWPTYTEKSLCNYFNSTVAMFADKDIDTVYGAICPGGNGADTSTLVQSVAGGYFGYVFSGNRVGKISYDSSGASGKFNGARSNRFDLDRISGIGVTTSNAHAIVQYAADNNLLLCPFWHDNTLNDANHTEYITYFNNLITEAKTAGLTFITTADLPNII